MMETTTGLVIKGLREKYGYTQDKVAEYLGIKREMISFYENEGREIPLEVLEKLSDLFGIELEAFFIDNVDEALAEVVFAFRKDDSHRLNKDEFDYSIGVIDQYFSFININKVDVTVDGIIDKARELVQRKGIKGLIIDPWNYIEHKVPPNQTETQYISESLTKFKAFALLSNIHIFIVAHPTKIAKSKDTGEYEVPTLYNISGSAHFFNKTDNGICMWRSFKKNEVTCYIQKVRYSWLGKVGNVSYTYNVDTRQYILINN